MKRLVLTEEGGPQSGREHSLESGELTLGRDEASRVRIEGAVGVSRRHAVVRSEGDAFWVADQGSANGTLVNGRVVEASGSWLQPGDLIELGPGGPRLRVRIAGPTADAGAPRAEEHAGRPDRRSLVDGTLYDPARHQEQPRNTTGLVVLLLMMGAGIAMGLLVVLIAAFELGPGASLVGVVVAFAPAPVYLTLWLWLDRYDPEPGWALGGVLVWGAGAATFVSLVVNTLFGAVAQSVTGDKGLAQFLSASISAPLVEEAAKGLAVLIVFLVLRREFDGVLDGVVYAGVVALGFATVENVLYYGRSLAKGGAGTLLIVFTLRGVLGPFSHAVFTSMTGIGCGLARQSHHAAVRAIAPLGGYLGAVFLHFLWNTLAGIAGAWFLVLYVVLWVPLFLAFFGVVLWMGFRESALIRRMLRPEVALGLISQEQADIAGSWPRRVRWLLGDLSRLQARRRFLHAATRLAMSYWHTERAANAGGETVSAGLIPTFRGEVARLKAEV